MMNSEDIHVMPVDDIREHTFEDCPCAPYIIGEGAVLIYVHNSYDGREYVEVVNRLLGIGEGEALPPMEE
jgi:hypothetical protein